MILHLSRAGAPPAEQIQDQIRGMIGTAILPADARLPSVRQLARDLGLAPGTVAKAYKALEAEGFLTTGVGAGTRVAKSPAATPKRVVEAAVTLVEASRIANVDLEDAIRVVRAIASSRR
jgi:GntR family transcriptional regulator